jgi:hypothetical protein
LKQISKWCKKLLSNSTKIALERKRGANNAFTGKKNRKIPDVSLVFYKENEKSQKEYTEGLSLHQ